MQDIHKQKMEIKKAQRRLKEPKATGWWSSTSKYSKAHQGASEMARRKARGY